MASVQFLEEILLTLFLTLSLFLLILYNRKNPAIQKKLPPSPPKLPIIGNLHQVGSRAHRSLRALSQRYGDPVLLRLGSKPALFVSSSKRAAQVFRTLDFAVSGRPNYYLARKLFYNRKDVLFGAYGAHWRHMRGVCVLHLLTNKRVRSFRRVREEEVALMASKIRSASTTVVNMSEMFMTLTADVICRVAFGRKYNGDQLEGGHRRINFPKFLKDLADLFGSHNVEDVLPWLAWINRLNGFNAKVNKFHRLFDEFLERIVLEHANRIKERTAHDVQDSIDKTATADFVDILLQVQREGQANDKALDNDSIKGVILDMFAAGTHTAQVTMEWAFTEILRHPRVLGRLQQEVRGIVGDKESAPEEDLEKMVYLKAVIKETLRLHPALPFLVPRECTEDVKMDEYDIASGTQVFINAWAIGRDPVCWEEPESFVPERFLDSTIDFKGHDFEFIPFGAGRRGCPGIFFATANMELALANLVHQFDWGLPIGGERESLDITETPGLSSHKLTSLLLVPFPRTN